MQNFTLPENCSFCNKKVDDREIVEMEDYKIYHPACFIKSNKKDFLEALFEKQLAFQESLGVKFNQQYIMVMVLSCIDEAMEILRETPWKPWKKNQYFNKQNYKEELVDLFHFFINLCLIVEMDAEELYNRYYSKLHKNYIRQKQDY